MTLHGKPNRKNRMRRFLELWVDLEYDRRNHSGGTWFRGLPSNSNMQKPGPMVRILKAGTFGMIEKPLVDN